MILYIYVSIHIHIYILYIYNLHIYIHISIYTYIYTVYIYNLHIYTYIYILYTGVYLKHYMMVCYYHPMVTNCGMIQCLFFHRFPSGFVPSKIATLWQTFTKNYGQSPFFMGNHSCINGPFSIALLVCRRLVVVVRNAHFQHRKLVLTG